MTKEIKPKPKGIDPFIEKHMKIIKQLMIEAKESFDKTNKKSK